MVIEIVNQQARFRLGRSALRQVVAALAARGAACRGAGPWRALTVILTDDAGMTGWNQRVMGHTGSTDVITQRFEPLPGESPGVRGELLVNVERAWQVAGGRTRGWSADRELALYIAHGCDHLNEAEDATPAGRRRMRRRELRWLRACPIPLLIAPLRVRRRSGR
jgi:ssRNA-specific RNase YbeY (16S rRNA maturation enzyme)